MIFNEIELSEALMIIGEGNPDNNLFFYNSEYIYPDLQNYAMTKIDAANIRNRKWFIRNEDVTNG